jgi:hypothetical protein
MSVAGCRTFTGPPPEPSQTTLTYWIRREADELFLRLDAIGFREVRWLKHRWLQRVSGFENPLLVFTFPPQHFAETTIAADLIPPVVPDAKLKTIELLPSADSKVVFRPRDFDRIGLNIEDLLGWERFDLVLPDLDNAAPVYELEVPRDDENPVTRIELPWGIDLQPLGAYGARGQEGAAFTFDHAVRPTRAGAWVELWTTALRSAHWESSLPFEVLSVRGFERTSEKVQNGVPFVEYADRAGTTYPKPPATLDNLDRVEIATSLSRRFPYTGKPTRPPTDSALIKYRADCVRACYDEGRAIEVEDFRLSGRGGSLELKTTWDPDPGCGLKGWTHSASLGRDHHVKTVHAGFLYPFGTEAELVTISERAFVRDERGHFVAPLFKQAFIQIPQPNTVVVDHPETIFRSISITTRRTPPLDIPKSGDPGDYKKYDFFLPTVDGKPFEFEHAGLDWANQQHSSRMPMYFVSNKVRKANGLIPEKNSTWASGPPSPMCRPETTADSNEHQIPENGEGLRVVDKKWNEHPYRFAKYGEALIAVAQPVNDGDTSQRVEWAEWARGIVRVPPEGEVAQRPFQPRTRTIKCRLQGMSQFSGERQLSLAVYRDTRFVNLPLLDPEPTAPDAIYFANIPERTENPSAPFLFLLETRDLISQGPKPPELSASEARRKIRATYFGSARPELIPEDLFAAIDNEVRFGRSASSDATGGLAVPDTHTSTINRPVGPLGDATFNPRRWPGYADKKAAIESARRLDYAAYRLRHRPAMDAEPFDASQSAADVEALATAAVSLMGFAVRVMAFADAAASSPSPQLNLGDMFGADAQILPGLRFQDVFGEVPVSPAAGGSPSSEKSADPLAWNFRVTGIDWLIELIGSGPGKLSMAELLEIAQAQTQNAETSRPIPFGLEASLDWTNTVFKSKEIGPIVFNPDSSTTMRIAARASMDLGLEGLPLNLSELKLDPARARVTSKASLTSFSVLIFKAIEVFFNEVSFTMAADGRKDFRTDIKDVQLTGPLAFINQLSKMLGGLGKELGIDIDISPARVKIGQTVRFPPDGKTPLFLGPAQITNLALSWGLMIPLIGRDVLTVSFALSSRERPMTIYVPPWYGGKAYILMELTTRGVKMLEISMEYGAIIPIRWGPASGEASIMAGIFYGVVRSHDPQGNLIGGSVTFRAFVKAVANLDIAGIIHFEGLISISLTHQTEGQRQLIIGETLVQVSIKIGFVRFSYSFSARHVDERRNEGTGSLLSGPMYSSAGLLDCSPTIQPAEIGDRQLFDSSFEGARRKAFERIVAGYVRKGRDA